jgi:hypothetical protein
MRQWKLLSLEQQEVIKRQHRDFKHKHLAGAFGEDNTNSDEDDAVDEYDNSEGQ